MSLALLKLHGARDEKGKKEGMLMKVYWEMCKGKVRMRTKDKMGRRRYT